MSYNRNFNDIFTANGLSIVVDSSTETDMISQLVNADLQYSEKVEILLSLLPEIDALPNMEKDTIIGELFKHSQFVAFRDTQKRADLEKKLADSRALESRKCDSERSVSDRTVFASLLETSSNIAWKSGGSSQSASKKAKKLDGLSANGSDKSPSMTLASSASEVSSEASLDSNAGGGESKPRSVWYMLSVDLAHKIFAYLLDPDMLGYLAQVAKDNPFAPRKIMFKDVCEYIYPRQCINGLKNREGGRDWQDMLISRPRLRVNGSYFLRTIYSKAHCNDNFWEGKKVEIIELKMYRNMRFFLDGYVLYSLGTKEPWADSDCFARGSPVHKDVFEGRYTLSGRDVIIDIFLHYGIVQFKCRIKNGDDGYLGNHNMLTIYEHSILDFSRDDKSLYDRIYKYLLVNSSAISSSGDTPVDMSFYENKYREEFINSIIDRYKLLEATNRMRRFYYNLPQYCDMRFFRKWDYDHIYHPA